VKGSLSFTGTGLEFSSAGATVRDAVALLKARQPNTRVLLGVGGATYTNCATRLLGGGGGWRGWG
jgi:hypothetical protein